MYMVSSAIVGITYYMSFISEMDNIGVARGPSLEEVTLEPADSEELDKFLNDDSTEQNARRKNCSNVEDPVK
jgi:hypothetical protein